LHGNNFDHGPRTSVQAVWRAQEDPDASRYDGSRRFDVGKHHGPVLERLYVIGALRAFVISAV
jgi:hypothetical protein